LDKDLDTCSHIWAGVLWSLSCSSPYSSKPNSYVQPYLPQNTFSDYFPIQTHTGDKERPSGSMALSRVKEVNVSEM
jgi:hypothetical protein